jgi:CRP/FNR family transcriptional regulator, cyclic AMP receptor protein
MPLARLGRAVLRQVQAGEVLVSQGQDDHRCWVVMAGAVASFVVNPAGKRALLEIAGPGDLAAGPHPLQPELRALGPGRVVVIPKADLALAAVRDPGVREWVHEQAVARLHRSQAALADVMVLSVPGRLHRFLLGLARSHGRAVATGTRIGIPLTQDILAAAVGATRETANRAVRDLERAGRISRAGRIYTVLPEHLATAPA